jgi:hypothetical protein
MKTKKNTIRLTESELKRVISESVKKVLRESMELAKNVPPQIQGKFIEKMKKEYPDLDPDGFFYMGGTLKHSGKKATKKKSQSLDKKLPSKVESNLSSEEYLKQVVLANDKNLEANMEEYDEEWVNLSYNALRGNSVDADYTNDYHISSMGRVLIVNGSNGKGRITNGYWDGTSANPQYRINLRTYGTNGNEITHNTPTIARLVAIAFLGANMKSKIRFKDGNPKHPYANNLEIIG